MKKGRKGENFMPYYDDWFDENWCGEPREEETALIEAIFEENI